MVFLERVSAALEHVDSSSGAIGTAVNRAIEALVPLLAGAPVEELADLVATTPGEEGKWFAAAKDAGLYDEALALAARSPCDPKTLTRAARDLAEREPAFALGAGLLALHWLVEGYGHEITGADVLAAYRYTMQAAERAGMAAEVAGRVRELVAREAGDGFVGRVLSRSGGL